MLGPHPRVPRLFLIMSVPPAARRNYPSYTPHAAPRSASMYYPAPTTALSYSHPLSAPRAAYPHPHEFEPHSPAFAPTTASPYHYYAAPRTASSYGDFHRSSSSASGRGYPKPVHSSRASSGYYH
jgi:hypothetical protein